MSISRILTFLVLASLLMTLSPVNKIMQRCMKLIYNDQDVKNLDIRSTVTI